MDNENKKNIINLISKLQKELNILTLFVTHDIESIKDLCENIVVLNKGEIVEQGLTKNILESAKNEYTQKLIDSTFKNKNFRN